MTARKVVEKLGEGDLDLDSIQMSDEPSFKFKFNGRIWHCRATDDISWPVVERFFQAMEAPTAGGIVLQMDSLFKAVLFPEEVEDFLKAKNQEGQEMTFKQFGELAQEVTRRVMGVPTQPSSTSRAGRRSTARTSEGSSSSRASSSRRAS